MHYLLTFPHQDHPFNNKARSLAVPGYSSHGGHGDYPHPGGGGRLEVGNGGGGGGYKHRPQHHQHQQHQQPGSDHGEF